MKRTTLALLFATCTATLCAQGTGPWPVVEITRESIKEGKIAAHARVEKEYANAFRKNKYPYHYLALSTVAGPSEVWFASGYDSFAAVEESNKASAKDPLRGAIEAVEGRDGEMRTTSRTMIGVFRPDLSFLPENGVRLAQTRYAMILSYQVRAGHEEEFNAGAKILLTAYGKAKFDTPILTYQIVAGSAEDSFIFYMPMTSLKSMDEEPAREKALVEAMGAENFQRFEKSADIFQSRQTALFSVSPEMSYMPKEVEEADPGFWKPKAAAPAKPRATGAQ